jgi:hypothetical protein
MVAGIFEKSKRLRKAFVFIVKKLPMSGAAERCDYPAECGAQIAPRCLAALNLAVSNLCSVLMPGKHDGASAGTSVPADAVQGVSPI